MGRRGLLLVSVAVGGIAVGALSAFSSASVTAKATITSVVFTGSEAHPVITIKGSGFGVKPKPDPDYHPPGHPLCPVKKPTGKLIRFGYDYATSLYLVNNSAQPVWAAGRYRPSLNELDCIGVVISKYNGGEIVYKLGAAYPHYPGTSTTFHLVAGNDYSVTVKGANHHGVVKYR